MPRVNHVNKSRTTQTCGRCDTKLPVGSPYKWAKRRHGPKMVRCKSCRFRPSDLSGAKYAVIQDAIEDCNPAGCGDSDSIKETLSDVASTAREVAEEYRESATNQQEYFPDSESAVEWEAYADELEAWADELEGFEPEEQGASAESLLDDMPDPSF